MNNIGAILQTDKGPSKELVRFLRYRLCWNVLQTMLQIVDNEM